MWWNFSSIEQNNNWEVPTKVDQIFVPTTCLISATQLWICIEEDLNYKSLKYIELKL